MPIPTPTAPEPPTVAVIGGGFSGLLTAFHLLHADPEVVVRLVERAPQFGRGRAYGTENPGHRLNVRVANMSAFPAEPDHFAAWLRNQGDNDGPGAFVSRGRYGDYLQDLLRTHVRDPDNAGRFLLEQDEAVDVEPDGHRHQVRLALGRQFAADAVVLAIGMPKPGPMADPQIACSPRYVSDPWGVDVEALPRGEALIVGSGLTMVDVALGLVASGRRVTAVSRHGLLPRSHAPVSPAPAPRGSLATPRAALNTLRTHAREVGWREAVDSVRPLTIDAWRSWTLAERRRFMRHLQVWWDVHRHRLAPVVAAQVTEHLASGALALVAGRVERLEPAAHGIATRIQVRGGGCEMKRTFDAVINCTGFHGDPAAASGLLSRLAARGALRSDPLNLGLHVDERLHVVDAQGRVQPRLFCVGPLTRSLVWEAIAVPDLRNQTAKAASEILLTLRDGSPAGHSMMNLL